ncbi:MAG: CvpA family protein [Chthoniobacteraceae bacterium]
MDRWTLLFGIGAVTLVTLMTWRGWRLGVVRQAVSMAALVLAYAAAWWLGGFLIPVLRWMEFPDRILAIIGAVFVGMVVYLALSIAAGIVFKRTSQQSVGVVKVGYGISGAALGAVFGVVLVLVCAVAIRLLGAIAETEKHPRPVIASLAAMKQSIEAGATGAIIEKVDPMPEAVYDTLGKVGQLASSPASLDRFSSNRDVQRVSSHPKLLALRDDPEVQRAIIEGDFFSLLRHPLLVEAANDPEVVKLLGTFDFQKALEHSLRPSQKLPAR